MEQIGRYHIRGVIGSGGFGRRRRLFRAEVAALLGVAHPNGPLDGPQSLSVLWGALSGLSAVHAVGTSHLIDLGLTSCDDMRRQVS